MNKPLLKVLIVEDSPFDARVMENVLRQGGYEIQTKRVETSGEMQTVLSQESWDIILADYNLPTFSGPAALEIKQQSGIDIPFIIVSGGIGEDVAVAAMKAGANDYIMKGNYTRLVAAVERELREAESRRARRQAEKSLRESELRYRLLWESASDALLLCDSEGMIHFSNPSVQKVLGFKPDELVGSNFSILQPPSEVRNFTEFFRAASPGSSNSTFGQPGEGRLLTRNGEEREVEISFSDFELHSKRWFVAFIRDITDRKHAEQELRENQEQFRVAREIQQHLFPKSSPEMPGFDVAGATYPAEAAGGDYFDFVPMLSDRMGIILGDVTGHGIGPALLMAETRAYLRILARNRDDLGEILSRANAVLAEDVGYERFVTLFLGCLDPGNKTFQYGSAGHPACYLLDSSGKIKTIFRRTGVPLGIRPDSRYDISAPIGLEKGDLLLLVTDGIEEAISADDKLFGLERTLEVVRENRHRSAREVIEALYQAVRVFSSHSPQLDDLTMVVVRVLD